MTVISLALNEQLANIILTLRIHLRLIIIIFHPETDRPHAHIKGGWPGPDTIHNGGHIQKKKLSGTNARAFRMHYSAFTENNGILHLSAHAYDQRYIYVYGTVRSLWLDTVAYPVCSGALSRTRRHFQTRVRFRHALFISGQSANTSASLSCIL